MIHPATSVAKVRTMAFALVNGVRLYYEEAGSGTPMIFVHEFAGETASWSPQLRFFGRRYRTIAFNARGYPPSDVPEDPSLYSQAQAVEDLRGVLDYLQIERAHVVGLSMGGFAALHFGLVYPARAFSLVVAGAGYGSKIEDRHGFRPDFAASVSRFESEPMKDVSASYANGPGRQQFPGKNPRGWGGGWDLLTPQTTKRQPPTQRP